MRARMRGAEIDSSAASKANSSRVFLPGGVCIAVGSAACMKGI